MRVVQTAHSYMPETSGVSEVVRQVSERLAANGHDVHVVTGRPSGCAAHEVVDGVHVHRFQISGNHVTGMRGASGPYVEFMRSVPWDAVAMHCAQTWSTDLLLPHLGGITGRKVFVGHGFSALDDPRYGRYFAELAERLRHVDAVVALSALLEEVPFCARHGLPQPSVIPNGVELSQFAAPVRGVRERWGIGSHPWMVSVSNHSPVKGHRALFDVVRRVRDAMPDALGTIVGGHYRAAALNLGRFGIKGGCWYRCRLEAARRDGVTLRWAVPRPAVVSALQEADVVLVTSSREASPLVVLESMAAGTPWVSFDVGCVREHTGGFVVRDRAEMAKTVWELLGDKGLRAEFGEHGRQRAREMHSWDDIARRYERVLLGSVGSASS